MLLDMMNFHPLPDSEEAALAVAAAVRAELARQRKTAVDVANVLAITPHTVGRRLSGAVPFNVVELLVIASWLDVPVSRLFPDTPERRAAS